MEEISYLRNLGAIAGQASYENRPIATEVSLGLINCAAVHLRDRHLQMEDICWPDSIFAHEDCLLSGLWIAFKHPSVLLAVFHLNSSAQQGGHVVVIDFFTFLIH